MSRLARSLLPALAALFLVEPAFAQLDTTRRAAVVRAGPDNRFPQVARLPTATNVHVHGCLVNRIWCDVQAGRTRGWVRMADLTTSSRLRNAATVTFSVAEYWDAHYRTRSWYASRDRWVDWESPTFKPPAR